MVTKAIIAVVLSILGATHFIEVINQPIEVIDFIIIVGSFALAYYLGGPMIDKINAKSMRSEHNDMDD